MTPAGPRRAGVLGHPIGHSLSPVLHRAAYAALGLAWSYEAYDVEEAALPDFLAGLDASWAGLSLTMPLKQAVLPLLDHVEPLAQVVGAVNTVLVDRGGARPVLTGVNTDVAGIVAALREGLAPAGEEAPPDAGARVPARVASAVVLGAGATAASAMAAVAELGCAAPTVFARSMARAGGAMRAASRMGLDPRFLVAEPVERLLRAAAGANVVVSTLPPHAADAWAAGLAEAGTPVRGVLLDCAYEPRPTALGAAWAAAGGAVVGGERMLLHQAVEQVRLMTGRPGPVAAMAAALAGALAP